MEINLKLNDNVYLANSSYIDTVHDAVVLNNSEMRMYLSRSNRSRKQTLRLSLLPSSLVWI